MLILVEIEELLELELLQIEAHDLALQEVTVLMIVQLEELIVQMQLDHLVTDHQDQQLEVQEALEALLHQAEVADQLDHISLQEATLEVAILQVEAQAEVLLEAVTLQVEAQAEVVQRQAEALLEVAQLVEAVLVAVLLEETKKKVDFKLFFQNQLLSLTL